MDKKAVLEKGFFKFLLAIALTLFLIMMVQRIITNVIG
jgi:hypothetical protein